MSFHLCNSSSSFQHMTLLHLKKSLYLLVTLSSILFYYYKYCSGENAGMACYLYSHCLNICYNLQNFLLQTYY